MNVIKKLIEIDVSEEFAIMFKTSQSLSSKSLIHETFLGKNGKLSKLLSAGRKRNYNEIIEEDKKFINVHEEVIKQITNKQKIIDDLISKVFKFEEERIKLLNNQANLAKLYEMEKIDDHGDPLQYNPYVNNDMR